MAYFPNKYDLISLTAPLVGLEMEFLKLVPIAEIVKSFILDLTDHEELHRKKNIFYLIKGAIFTLLLEHFELHY